VEDEFLQMTDLKQLVRDSKGEVAATCRNLADFRRQWPAAKADIAIVDLRLGKAIENRDGWLVVTEISKSDKPMPIIICSSYNDEELWRTLPRYDNIATMGKDTSLNQYLITAYPLVHKFYPNAERMFLFHPGGHSITAVNDNPTQRFFVKNNLLGYAQMIDPRFVTLVECVKDAKIRIHYEDQVIDISQTLDGFCQTANYNRLVKVNRSFVVNYNYVHGRDSTSLYVKTWSRIREVPLGDGYDGNTDRWWK
jgi:hypothetical protein